LLQKNRLFSKILLSQVRLNDFKSSFLFFKNDNFVISLNDPFRSSIVHSKNIRSFKKPRPSFSFRFSAEKNKLQALQWSMVLITDLFSAVIIPYYQERGQLALITLN